MEQVWDIAAPLIVAIVVFLAGRFSVRTKVDLAQDDRIEDIEKRTEQNEENISDIAEGCKADRKTHYIILKCLLPLLLSVKGQKPNGELSSALDELNKHMMENSCK